MSIIKEDIKLIYEKYMTMSFDEIDIYLNEIATKNSCTIDELKKEIEDYAKGIGLEEYQKYLLRKKEVKNNNYKYVKNVMDLLNRVEKGETIDFSEFKRNKPIENEIRRCISLFPEKSKELEKLLENVEKYIYIDSKQRQNTCLFVPDYNIIKSMNIKSKYIEEIIDILNCETEEEAITYMRKLQFTEKHFNLIIAGFTAKFKNSNEYTPKLEYLFNQYQEFIKSNTDEIKRKLDSKKEYNESINQIVISLIESGYSIEEFCHHNLEFNIKYVEDCVKKLIDKNSNIKLLKEKNSNQEFINELEYIISKIKTGNYDCIDYYMDTKLNFNDFNLITRKYGMYDVAVSIFISKNKKSTVAINRDSELNGTRIIKEREITREEKEMIFAFLEENQIPINMHTYKTALNRYLEGTLDISIKQYTKR